MNSLANSITNYYIRKNIIPEEKAEIYCYGFKLIIADIINYAIIIALGLLVNKVLDSIIFLVVLCGLRLFCGGFHARTFWLCRTSMVLTYTSVIVLSELMKHTENIIVVSTLVNFLCVLFLCVFAPIEHENKPLSKEQKKSNKYKSIVASSVISIIAVILLYNNIKSGVTVSITLLAVIVLMIIAMFQGKEEHKNA